MRRLIVVRHGKAFKESPTGLDADRELQPRGQRQAAWLAQAIERGDSPPSIVMSSPFARARATAEPIARALRLAIRFERALEAERPLGPVLDLIAAERADSFAIVGHNYQLSDLVGLLVDGVGARSLELRTGQAAVIELDARLRPGHSKLALLLRDPDGD